MDNTFQNDMKSFEVDSAAYRDAMNEELVDNLEVTLQIDKDDVYNEVTDELLRKLLIQIQKAGLAQENAVDTFDKELMVEVAEASLKND
ncbi:MAG: hypothetical protein IKL07_05840 [Clostridium sp.]|mgnify:CR=1 FL=1|nr:hypothetical protein [Clostridium sp.]